MVFESLPRHLAKENKKFVYGVVKKGFRGRELDDALQFLQDTRSYKCRALLAFRISRGVVDDKRTPCTQFIALLLCVHRLYLGGASLSEPGNPSPVMHFSAPVMYFNVSKRAVFLPNVHHSLGFWSRNVHHSFQNVHHSFQNLHHRFTAWMGAFSYTRDSHCPYRNQNMNYLVALMQVIQYLILLQCALVRRSIRLIESR